MAKDATFKVSKKGFPEFEVTASLPENLTDERWNDIVSEPSDVHDLAIRSWVVQVQANARGRLDEKLSDEDNLAAAQAAVNQYVYGARSGGFVRPTVSATQVKELKFSPDQLAALRALGVNVAAE